LVCDVVAAAFGSDDLKVGMDGMDLLSGSKKSARVLIVEDDPVTAHFVQHLFTEQQIHADLAFDGATALAMHRERTYRLVVSDWNMPNMDGVELCRAMREIGGRYLYFILLTGNSDRGDYLRAFEAGIDDCLAKPLDALELHAKLNVARRILSREDEMQAQRSEMERSANALHEMNSSLMLASRRFEELFNGLPVACFTLDESGLIHEWNREAENTFGIRAFQAIQRPVHEVFSQQLESTWTEEMVEQIFRGEEMPMFDWTYTMPTGGQRYFACNVICIRSGANGQPVGAVSANLDITQRKLAEQQVEQQMIQLNDLALKLEVQKEQLEEMNERLSHLAITDGLTGLWNHRRFQEFLEQSIEQYRQTDSKFSLVLLDIDHFKRFNDDFGHQIGDEVLKEFADTLLDTARWNEQPARYGGEEFALILHECDAELAMTAAERFRLAIRNQPWRHRQVTASLGVATIAEGIDAKLLIQQADTALYASKRNGRDRVTHFASLDEADEAAA
jgi:two-component system, cell cycle response regulator